MNTGKFERKLSAILSADVKGYSRLMRADEDETIRTLTAYRTAIAKLVEQYRGRVVDSPGDNVLAEFGSGVDAVNCAVEVQRELAERNEELPAERKMEFRIGVNLGDIVQEGERIYGDGVNIAARVEGLAEGGGICVSGTVYDSIESKLGLEFEYLGEHEVKNIDKPIRVYRILSYPGAAAHRVIKAKKAVGKTWRKAALAAVAVIVVGAAVAVWHFYFRPPLIEPASVEKMAFKLPEKPSIAVLPFVNMSGDPEQEYIADGITENIISALSKIPKLFVIDRNSTFTYKGTPVKVQKVAEDLGVQYVLEGSVQRSGDNLRITAQLIDALGGHHLWSERYDRELKDIFALQDEITLKICNALQMELTSGEQARMWHKGTKNLEAWGCIVKGNALFTRMAKGDNAKARNLYERAVKIDPKDSFAWTMLAWTHWIDAFLGYSESRAESFKQAVGLAKKALSMDDTLSDVYALLGGISLFQRHYEKAIAAGEKSIALGPNSATSHVLFGSTMTYAGRFEEAIALIKKGMRLTPHYPAFYLNQLGRPYFQTGRYKEALATYKKLLKRSRKGEFNPLSVHLNLAATYIMLDRDEEARAQVAEVLRISPNLSLEWVRKATFYKDPAHLERVLIALRKAGLPEKPPLPLPDKPSIAVLPFANISGDPKEDYLSDGITENIITALSKTPQMLVIARNSVFTYKGKPVMVQQVSDELGVRYVLEGSVQKSGDKLRVTAQLIDAKTGNHLWSERYDRDLKDLFELQDDITKNVITALQIKLTYGTSSSLGEDTENLEAYLKVMKGLHYHFRFNKDDNETARRLYEKAIELDPNYVNAYVLLAWTYYDEASHGWTKTPAKSYEKAVELTKKALSLDKQKAGAYFVLANVYAKTGQLEKAVTTGKKAFSLDPANPQMNAQYGMMLYHLAKFKEVIPIFEKVLRREPKPPWWCWACLGYSYYRTGQNEEAIAVFRKWVGHMPGNALAHASLGLAYVASGKLEEAIAMLEKALSLHPDRPGWYMSTLAVARLGTGKQQEAITAMRDLVSRHPNRARFYCRFSMVLTSEGKYEEALSMAKKAASLEKVSPIRVNPADSYSTLGDSYCMMGKHEGAIAAFKKAIGFWPEYIYPHIGLTASYSLAGRMEDARAEAAEVLKINPKITLEDIAKNGYYNFQKADKERFLNALRKAGLK